MVKTTEQRTGKVRLGLKQGGDFPVQSLKSSGGDGLPFADVRSVEDSCDISEGEPRVLKHSYEHEPSESGDAIAPLP